ncbi:MAG: aspartate/glutamate racemase family protein [Rubrivivax sp.]|nr:aspartate/glutamate racemase family protein [Rubrivivax sp.]
MHEEGRGAGPVLGILKLDTQFPRLPGDAGHPGSWAMPVRFRVVEGAVPLRVVRENDPAVLRPFIDAARALVAEGARALTTTCGFLVRHQAALQAAVPVPVWSSSLLALPALHRPGVLTVDAASLGAAELQAAGADPATPVQGLTEGGHLQTALLNNRPTLDPALAEADTVAAALALVRRRPDIESLVLECTNLPPYAVAVQRATGRPVHHLMTLVHERWKALS